MTGLGRSGYAVYRFDPKTLGLERKARDALGRFTNLQGVALQVHRQAVEQMAQWAVGHLDDRIRREPGKWGRTNKLERAITSPRSHVANRDGFEFMVAARMFEQVSYWRAIERGSDHLVGMRLRLAFYSGGRRVKPSQARTGRGEGSGAQGGLDSARILRGETPNGRPKFVTIRRPIQAYGYGGAAEERFVMNDFAWYRNAMDREVSRLGLKMVT